MKVPVSILVPIKNEAANLPRCLASISWADEIFVVDSQSTDGSQALAAQFGADIVQFQFNGTWPKKRNWALGNLSFSNEWVLILDADEELPPEAREEIEEICTANSRGFDGYFINRRFMFMGKWLRHAYSPNWILRLFKHKLGRYQQMTARDTGSGDHEIHEPLILQGRAGRMKAGMNHYAFPTVDVFVEKHTRYAGWEAAVALDYYQRLGLWGALTKPASGGRERLRRLSYFLPFRPFFKFLYVYFFQLGFLDGPEGYYFARLHAFYEFLSICKTHELKKKVLSGKR